MTSARAILFILLLMRIHLDVPRDFFDVDLSLLTSAR